MLREASPFGEKEWQHIPWTEEAKSVDQQIYDCGFELGSLLERADRLKQTEPNSGSQPQLVELLRSCLVLNSAFEKLHQEHFGDFLLTNSQALGGPRSDDTRPETASPAVMNQIMLVLNLWGMQLLLGFVADGLGGAGHRLSSTEEGDLISLGGMCQSWSNESALAKVAYAILRYMPLCLGKGASESTASRTIFPITVVMWQFRHSPAEFARAGELKKQILEMRNMRFIGGNYQVKPLLPNISRDDGGLTSVDSKRRT